LRHVVYEIHTDDNENKNTMYNENNVEKEINKTEINSHLGNNNGNNSNAFIFDDIYDVHHFTKNNDVYSSSVKKINNHEIKEIDVKREVVNLQQVIENLKKINRENEVDYKSQIETMQAKMKLDEMRITEFKENIEKLQNKIDNMELQTKTIINERNQKTTLLENEKKELQK